MRSGEDLPVPERAVDVDGLTAGLRMLKVWAGNPSYSAITRRVNDGWLRTGRTRSELTQRSTVAGYFTPGRSRLSEELLVAIVSALHPDPGYAERWRRAMRTIRGEAVPVAVADTRRGLPPDPPGFVGRERELSYLDTVDAPVVAITGMAGVGKTRLAIHAAHRLLDHGRFPDIQLYVDLRGFDDAAPPVPPVAALGGFLRHLGLPGGQIPSTLAGRVGRYRELLRGRRALILLDNADSARAIEPLLADAPGCLTLVTSRHAMTVPAHLELDVFTPAESLRLLRGADGTGRVAADPVAADRIARELGNLPLALSVVAGHLRDHPDWTLADYLVPLTRLALEGGLRAALALSDRDLSDVDRLTVRLLAVQPGQSITVPAAAALTGQPVDATRRQLDALAGAHLVQVPLPGRYGLHDVVRAWAVERATVEQPASRMDLALRRLFDHYRAGAAQAMDALYPYEMDRRPRVDPPESGPALAPDEDPGDWLDAEQANLLACAADASRRGWTSYATDLNAILWRHMEVTGRFAAGIALAQEARYAARLAADRTAETRALLAMGALHARLGEYDEALEPLQRALAIARAEGDRVQESRASSNVGAILFDRGRHDEALGHLHRALAIARELDDPLGIARSTANLAAVYFRLGRYEDSLNYYAEDHALTRQAGDRPGEAVSLANIAIVYNRLGRHSEALDHLWKALDINRENGNRLDEGRAHDDIGVAYQGLGRFADALRHHSMALELLREAGSRAGEGSALNNIGLVCQGEGRYAEAIAYHRRAIDIHREHGDEPREVVALVGLGETYRRAGSLDEAATVFRTVLARDPYRYEQACAHAGLGHICRAAGLAEQAEHHWREALDRFIGMGVPEADRLLEMMTSMRRTDGFAS